MVKKHSATEPPVDGTWWNCLTGWWFPSYKKHLFVIVVLYVLYDWPETHTHTLGNRGDIKAEVSVMRVLPASVSLSSLRLLHQQFKNPLSSSELRTVVHQSRGWIMYEYVGTATDMTQLVLIFTTLRQGLWIGWLNCYVNSTETADPWHHQDEAVAPKQIRNSGDEQKSIMNSSSESFWSIFQNLSTSVPRSWNAAS